MGGRGLGQPAAGREGIIGTREGKRKDIIGTSTCDGKTSTCDGEGEGTASCREGRYNKDRTCIENVKGGKCIIHDHICICNPSPFILHSPIWIVPVASCTPAHVVFPPTVTV